MHLVNQATIDGLRAFDSATVFNALVRHGGLPNEEYTDHTIRCLLPELGPVVGYAVTAEVTTNDPDTAALDWPDYYEALEAAQGPLVAVLKDVDARPGRGASFGDGMATVHKRLGVVGAIVDGTVRDFQGIQRGVADLGVGQRAGPRRLQRDTHQHAGYRGATAGPPRRSPLCRQRRLRAHSQRSC
ncbi:MAG: hypothetical protein R2867_35865 [Caldilineaceae bacterium]